MHLKLFLIVLKNSCISEMQQPDSLLLQKEVDLSELFDPKGTVCFFTFCYDLVST